SIKQLTNMKVLPGEETIVRVRGKIHLQADGKRFVEDETGSIALPTVLPPLQNENHAVEILGRLTQAGSNFVLQNAFCREFTSNSQEESASLPVLTTVEQIKRLSREEWQRGYPVKIRGVITSILDS